MQTPATSLIIAGVGFARSPGQPAAFEYYPALPSIARHDSGEPQLTWVPDTRTLLLAVQWRLPPGTEALLQRIGAFAGVRLVPAELHCERVELAWLSDAGEAELLDTATSSGYPPFQAVFNVQLTRQQAAAVDDLVADGAALPLRIAYHGHRVITRRAIARCRILGDAAAAVQALADEASRGLRKAGRISTIAARRALQAALDTGDLRREVDAGDDVAPALRDEVIREAERAAAKQLRAWAEKVDDEPDDAVRTYQFTAGTDTCVERQETSVTRVPITCVRALTPPPPEWPG